MAIARRGPRRVLGRGPGTKDLIKAAGQTGRQMAELAIEVRQARQQLATDRKRSPIEVVLDGLTARRSRDMAK